MKGIIFRNFLEMVEAQFGYETVDAIISKANLPSGGSYTSVGSYHVSEIVALVSELSRRENIAVPLLLQAYGEYLFNQLAKSHGHHLEGMTSAFDLLKRIDLVIHQEVRKIYQDAQLPEITATEDGPGRMRIDYRSPRCLAAVAEGMIISCIKHFGDKIDLIRDSQSSHSGETATFWLQRQ